MKRKLIVSGVILTLSLAGLTLSLANLTGFDTQETLEAQPTFQTVTVWQGDNIIHETTGNINIDIKPEYIKVTDNDTGTVKIIDADDITLIERADIVEYK